VVDAFQGDLGIPGLGEDQAGENLKAPKKGRFNLNLKEILI